MVLKGNLLASGHLRLTARFKK